MTISSNTGMPHGIHIAIVVYGHTYTSLFSEITLANLAALVLEIPQPLRDLSRVRILTTESDRAAIEKATALILLQSRIRVELIDTARLFGYEKHGNYGPMVAAQRLLILEATRSNAAIFLVGPDLIFNRGAFQLFVDCLNQGYRLVIGPGPRVNRDATRSYLKHIISASPDGSFALTGEQQIDLLFRQWHRINDRFVMANPESIWWKAYIYHRPHPDELFMRFFQGPTFVAWPRSCKDEFNDFADLVLPELCCESWREVHVIANGNQCLALDLTDESYSDFSQPANFPSVYLLVEFFQRAAIKDLKLLYGLRTCRVHRGERDPDLVRKWKRELARFVDPLLALAIAERWIRRRLGKWPARVFKIFCMLNTHTVGYVVCPFTPYLLRKWNTQPRCSVAFSRRY